MVGGFSSTLSHGAETRPNLTRREGRKRALHHTSLHPPCDEEMVRLRWTDHASVSVSGRRFRKPRTPASLPVCKPARLSLARASATVRSLALVSAPPFTLLSHRWHLLRLALATAALVVVLPAAAWANASVSEAGCPPGVTGTCVYYTGNGNEFDAYDFTADAAYVYLSPVRLDDNPALPLGVSMTPGNGCLPHTTPGAVKCELPATAIVIDAKGGDDWLAKHLNCGGCMRVIADLGEGNDLLRGTVDRDDMKGGPGNDFFASYEGDDRLDGGPGDDTFDPQLGADDIVGGSGYDTVVYFKTSAQPVSVTLDDLANDGELGEKDNVHGDVEDITGGKGNDTLTGNALANVLRGDLDYVPIGIVDGNDVIDGGGGSDSLFGEGGNDTLKARDGVPDTVDCGLGTDTAIVDTIDTVRNCETVDASKELEPDADGDGIAKPADCK